MLDSHRFTIKIAGESGQGINSVGELIAKALKNCGYYIFGYREYPSLIRGGVACYQLDFSDRPVSSSKNKVNILLCISRASIHHYLRQLSGGGILIHSLLDVHFSSEEKDFILNQNIKVIYINAEQEALLLGGRKIMANVIFTGLLWRVLNLEYSVIESVLLQKFKNKPQHIEMNKKCLTHGYNIEQEELKVVIHNVNRKESVKHSESYLISGNEALSLGAIAAGMRAFYAYPMTPSSSILSYLSKTYKSTGIIVKQVEDEISAVQMALGSMYVGTRAMTATSGGGFDLMTESVSLSGITEIPLVIVLAQRPGPATGLPTWTAAGDLLLAIHSGHGEFPRAVISVSDASSAYELIQHAFNIAEVYQIPVIILTEKQIGESLYNVENFSQKVPIERGLLSPSNSLLDDSSDSEQTMFEPQPTDRYHYSENGISDRWLPGQFKSTYNTNSDEHSMDGSATEESEPTIAIVEKRMRKLLTLKNNIPEPTLYGNPKSKVTFVGWGSSKGVMLDVLKVLEDEGKTNVLNYLHYDFLYPLRFDKLKKIYEKGNKIVLIENNYLGQLGLLIAQESGILIKHENKLLKYDGRPFFVEDVYNFIKSL